MKTVQDAQQSFVNSATLMMTRDERGDWLEGYLYALNGEDLGDDDGARFPLAFRVGWQEGYFNIGWGGIKP
jgi:hypothetical protein